MGEKKKTIAHASFLSLSLYPPLFLSKKNSPASNASTTTSADLSAASVAARSSSRLDVSTIVRGTPSGVASAGNRVGGWQGGGDIANVSVAAAVMSAVFPTRGSPATTTVTARERWGKDIVFVEATFGGTKRDERGKSDAENKRTIFVKRVLVSREKKSKKKCSLCLSLSLSLSSTFTQFLL